jgi:hypothetical protein
MLIPDLIRGERERGERERGEGESMETATLAGNRITSLVN